MISRLEKPKVLIVEDDKSIREALRYNLIAENYSVTYEEDGIEALDNILENHYDIILLDIMLPNLDGMEICKRTRFENINTPIIMLTAKDTDLDKILGLELGADDYVSKPFSMPELLARIKANIRRNKFVSEELKSTRKKQFTHLDIFFDLDKRLISVEGQEKFFRPKEFDLAYLLMSNPGKVFTREKLVQEIWGFEYFGDSRTVDVHIRWIREKIENNNTKPSKILTVRGVGYKANME
ncbi:MAG: DNA-binding response regulator [Chloroflexi bacterium]|nr:DNA-binding response regulator [Chloroflexota bacterium]|tara:strand:- start:11003 stop:11719 length:717 start_codon:yes stop_codon:yes gene_type:complete